jgi:hypothetical protein
MLFLAPMEPEMPVCMVRNRRYQMLTNMTKTWKAKTCVHKTEDEVCQGNHNKEPRDECQDLVHMRHSLLKSTYRWRIGRWYESRQFHEAPRNRPSHNLQAPPCARSSSGKMSKWSCVGNVGWLLEEARTCMTLNRQNGTRQVDCSPVLPQSTQRRPMSTLLRCYQMMQPLGYWGRHDYYPL